MKHFNIAVMLLDTTNDYSLEILAGISEYYKDKNVNTLITQVKLPNVPYGLYEYQYWAGRSLLVSESIDAVIVVSSFFVSSIDQSKFVEYLRLFSHKPIISIGVDLPFTNSYSLKTDCSQAYDEIFQHLTQVHGCNRIAFLSANNTKSEEAAKRYNEYIEMLNKYGLQFDPNLVFDGNYTLTSGEAAFESFSSKKDITFDALICANDQMALGAMNALTRLGVSIPEDVKVFGFDNTIQARNVIPSLCSISQQIFIQGMCAAEMALNVLTDKPVEKQNVIPLKVMYRQSCGCIGLNDQHSDFLSDDGQLLQKDRPSHNHTVEEYVTANTERNNMYYLLDALQNSESLTDLFTRFVQIMYTIDLRRIAVCLYEEPIVRQKGEPFTLPSKVELALAIDREHRWTKINPGLTFDPHEQILPDEIFDEDYAPYIMEALFHGEKQYGYVLYKLPRNHLSLSSIYIKMISNAITSAYEYTRKQIENQNLSDKNEELEKNNSKLQIYSKTDELTQIYNRRGFLFSGQKVLALAHARGKEGIVIFCDMDGLKKINDTYGHEMGDAAIISEALALTRTFSMDSVIGRLSGDEFAIITMEYTIADFPKLYKKILKNCKTIAKERKFPFELSVSAGAVKFDYNDTDLQTLLSQADSEQYKEKRKKHSSRSH